MPVVFSRGMLRCGANRILKNSIAMDKLSVCYQAQIFQRMYSNQTGCCAILKENR